MLFRKTVEKINAITSGQLVDLTQVDDPVFSKKLVGDGYAIEPSIDTIYAPCDGKVSLVFPTKHAYGLKTKKGTEILIHLGIDTVELNGEGFEAFVSVDDAVKKGQIIGTMDRKFVESKGKKVTSMVIITSGESISKLLENQDVTISDVIITV